MEEITNLGKALSDATRIRILAVLRMEALCVCEVGDALEITQSTLSAHLQVLRQAGIVTTRKNKKWIYYGIAPEKASVLDAVFAHYDVVLSHDSRLKRDAERVENRLRIRVDGCCVVSFALAEIQTKGHEIK